MQKNKELKRVSVINAVVLLTMILNVYGVALSRVYHLPIMIFTAVPLVLLFVCLFVFNNKKLKIDYNLKTLLYINTLIFVFHLIFCGLGSNEIKYYLYFIVFLVVNSLVERDNWKIVEVGLIGIALFLSFDALKYLPDMLSRGVRIYNVANYTILDKSVYTLIPTLAFVCLLINFLDRQASDTEFKRICSLVLMVFFAGINLILIQSKIFILVMVATICILYFFTNGRPKKFVRVCLIFAVVIIVVVFVAFPQIVPEYIYVFLNRFLGVFGDAVTNVQAYDRYAVTYNMRGNVYSFAFDLFLNHPVIGVGFGNYKIYAIENASFLGGVTQTESSMMNILVEGGVIYFIAHLCLLIIILLRIICAKRKNPDDLLYTKLLIIIVAYIILNAGNDFYNVLYWMILGYIYKLSGKKRKLTWE